VNREKVAKQAAERAARDAEIARKKKEEGTADEEDARIASGNTAGASAGGGEGGWARNQTRAMAAPPDRERPARTRETNGEDNAFVRSEKPRAALEEEAKKPEGFGRAPRREAPAADTGFARGNFAKKDASGADTAKPEGRRPRQQPPKESAPTTSSTPGTAAGSGFGGFRNSNAASRGGSAARGGAGATRGRKFM